VLCPAAGARASRIKVTRERKGGRGQARRARRLVVCIPADKQRPCLFLAAMYNR